jgi:hypothetical protein
LCVVLLMKGLEHIAPYTAGPQRCTRLDRTLTKDFLEQDRCLSTTYFTRSSCSCHFLCIKWVLTSGPAAPLKGGFAYKIQEAVHGYQSDSSWNAASQGDFVQMVL